jgi:hypothetical protein
LTGGEGGDVGSARGTLVFGLEVGEARVYAGELTVVHVLVAVKKVGRADAVGGASQGESGADGGWTDFRVLNGHVAINAGFLNTPDAELAPLGDGEGLNQGDFGGGDGLEFLDVAVQEAEEALFGFLFEDDGAGEEAVADTVAGGDGFALGGNGAFGFGAVDAGGSICLRDRIALLL